MKIEDRLRRELSDTAEHLALDQDTYEHVLDLGRRRRRARQLAVSAAGAAIVVTAIAGVLAFGPFGATTPIVSQSTTTTPQPVATTMAPVPSTPAISGIAIATEKGIVLVSPDGATVQLSSDLYYESISWVISDGDGGLLFQHDVTPLPWTQGTILHLPVGESHPNEVVAPDPGTYIRPVDTDSGSLLYRVDAEGTSEIRSIDLETNAIRTIVPPTEFLVGATVEDGLVLSAYGGDCPRLEVFSVDGTKVQDPSAGECQTGFINDIAFSGGYIYTIEDGEGRNLVRRDFATGAATTTPVEDAWSVAALPDGTVAIAGTEIVVGAYQGDVFVESWRAPAGSSFTLARVGGFPAEATLGSGSGDLPCTPLDVPPVSPQGLPGVVEDQRSLIFRMAASCDLEGLAELAVADGTAFTYGGESDPLRSWIRSARNGFDVMMWIVRLFNSTPAVDESGTYAWPAVHATNSDEDWQELSGILTAAEFEQYSRYRDSGWLGLRIGIAEDGNWSYVIAGD